MTFYVWVALIWALSFAGGITCARFLADSDAMQQLAGVMILGVVLVPVIFWLLAGVLAFAPSAAAFAIDAVWVSAVAIALFLLGWMDPLRWVRRH